MPDLSNALVYYVVFLLSTTLHEAAHAWAAARGGDLTAYHGGQVSLDPFPNQNVNRSGDDYAIYYTQTGRAGGAYRQDTNGDGVDDWVPVNDPRVFEEGRNVRLGVSIVF